MKHLTNEELQHGIDRCKARISGLMPKGIINLETIKKALIQYKEEQQKRGILEIDI